ncbi:histidine kinase 3 isoform X2 [Magnolia sinica]|uniref:histidine kinase 3 isoform X2 n=1 Tax=Magnolia sinica TaxID=86752 RepID=UPI00265A0034|nr:histidine kinase 3 isoform X2 [Magnolia sinica]
MSFSAIAGVFLKLPRLFLRICRWVLVRMALNCKAAGFNGGFAANSKAKELSLGSNDGWKWRRMVLVLWALSGVMVSIWVFSDLKDGGFSRREKIVGAWEEKEQFNVSKDEVRALASLFSKSDQEVEQNMTRREAGYSEQCGEKLSMVLLNIGWWVLVGMAVNCKFSSFLGRLWMGSKQQKAQQQQQVQLPQQQQQQSQSSKGGWGWRRKLLFVWVVAGVIGSTWIFWSMRENFISRRKETLANMCDERARMLQDQFNVSMNHVHAMAILISTFHHGKQPSAIDQKTFAEYTERTAFERPLTSGVAYALRVLHSEREQFEKEHGWTIKKMETEDQSPVQEYNPEKLDPSPVQSEYAPVVFSQDTVSHIVSIDMMSGKEDRENILRARASGKGVLTSPFKLLKSNQLGVVLTFAVYSTDLLLNATPDERIAATRGYLGACFDVQSLVEKLLHQLASKQTIVVNVYDTTNESKPINMYGPNVTDTGPWHLSTLDFGDPFRSHEMHCRFKQKPPLPWSAITTSAGVLVIALLVGHIFHAALNRIAKVEDDYRKMRELKVRAEAADVAKSQFLATVSHEIRTPMNGVLGMLQMLLDTDLDTTQREYAKTAQGSGKDLIALINEVLDQAKIESGRLELETVPFDVRAVLDNVISLFYDKSQEKGIELAVYISDQVPEILNGDPGRFRQIITNLVSNSIKFTEQGHVYVSVHLANEVAGLCELGDEVLKQPPELLKNGIKPSYNTLSGLRVVDRQKSWESFKMLESVNSTEVTDLINLLVTVEDTGVGIPLDAQTRIFLPFMQADSSTSRTYGGTGIGLSISKCLVDLMGGEIGCVSEPGIGSVFAFTAGFTKGQGNATDAKRQQSESMASEFGGMKALVVDGRSIRAEVTKYHLQRLGIHVEIAVNRKSAFSCILNACNSSATERLDMVLVDKEAWGKEMDLIFPRLLKELKQNGRPKPMENLPKMFLLATSISSPELDELRLAGYIDNVIKKPLRLSMMSACLQQALGIGNKQHQDRGQPSTLLNLLSGKKILVVDDNVVNRRVAAGALKKYGAVVACADSGKSALAMLQPPHEFDACFMDVQMPEMDGFEATRKIRSTENKVNEQIKSGEVSKEMYGNVAHWHMPILAMTADVIQATNEECSRCGMDGYVSKPFEEEQLYAAVARFFESDAVELAC